MGSFTLESEMGANAVKAAKKVLKKHDEPSMKIKALAKAVVAKLGDDVREKDVRKLVEKSDKFSVEGKLVSFTKKNKAKNDRKRKSKDENEQEGVSAGGGSESSSSKKKKKTSSSSFDAAAWRTEHKIVLRGPENEASADKALNENPSMYPLASFDDERCRSSIAPELVRHCSVTKGFATPSPVQAQCWPILSPPSSSSPERGERTGGRDVVGIAETGSGKTLAFSLPALTAMRDDDARTNGGGGGKRAPRMLVLAPTRELAMQSHEVLEEYGALVGLRSLVVYGGVPKHSQTKVLRGAGTDCLVATPGRLRDLLNDGVCDLSRVAHLVLDEADRMLDMGFEEDVRDIVGRCVRPGRRTHMFSATWPPHVRKAASDYAVDPIRVYVGVNDARANGDDDDQGGGGGAVSLSANERVSQTVEVIEDRARDARLRALLREHHDGRNRVLIFALYKKEAARVERSLLRDGWNCCSVHGDKGQADRTQALARFKDGSSPLMIATDVAARGLDVPDVEVVINYTFPLTIEDYVHRIGRTGRAGRRGASFTFFQPSDKGHAGELQAVMRRAGQPIPEELAKFGSTIKKKEHNLYGNFGPKGGVPMKKATRIVFD